MPSRPSWLCCSRKSWRASKRSTTRSYRPAERDVILELLVGVTKAKSASEPNISAVTAMTALRKVAECHVDCLNGRLHPLCESAILPQLTMGVFDATDEFAMAAIEFLTTVF